MQSTAHLCTHTRAHPYARTHTSMHTICVSSEQHWRRNLPPQRMPLVGASSSLYHHRRHHHHHHHHNHHYHHHHHHHHHRIHRVTFTAAATTASATATTGTLLPPRDACINPPPQSKPYPILISDAFAPKHGEGARSGTKDDQGEDEACIGIFKHTS